MRCLTCQTENAQEAKFCRYCGTPLQASEEIKEAVETDDGKTKSIMAIILISLALIIQIIMYVGEEKDVLLGFIVCICLIIGTIAGLLGAKKSKKVHGSMTTVAIIGRVLAYIAWIILLIYLVLILISLVLMAIYVEHRNTVFQHITNVR